MAKETFKSNGMEYTIVRDDRYKIPIAIPTGIYNILDSFSRNSVLSPEERHKAREKSKQFSELIRRARAEDAKLTPGERQLRDERLRQEKEKRELKHQEETLKLWKDFEARQEATRREHPKRFEPPIVLKGPDPRDPRVQRFNKEMEELFGPPDER